MSTSRLRPILTLFTAITIACQAGDSSPLGPDDDDGDLSPQDSTSPDDPFDPDASMDPGHGDLESDDSDPDDPSEDPSDPSDDPGLGTPVLEPAANCEEAWDLVEDRVIADMAAALAWAEEDMVDRLHGDCWDDDDDDDDADDDTGGDDDDDDDDQADDASDTNNQVEGVDEPDFVKNDLSHIYVLADNELQIIDAWPAKDMHRVSATPIDGTPKKMFVANERAFVYASGDPVATSDPAFWQAANNTECTYGYDCDFVGDGRQLTITQFDLSDLAAPQRLRETTFEGSLLGARRIGDRVYTMAVFPTLQTQISEMRMFPEVLEPYRWACEDEIPFTEAEIRQHFADLQAENTALIESLTMDRFLPKIRDVIYDPSTGQPSHVDESLLDDCEGFYVSSSNDGLNPIVLLSTTLGEPTPYVTNTILGRPGTIYANERSLFLASRHYRHHDEDGWFFPDDPTLRDATAIHGFVLEEDGIGMLYLGSGAVKGRVLNQFSLDEHAGHLRVATTTGRLPSYETHNTLSVLRPVEGRLVEVGRIDDIAPTEDIRSVRFDGDVGFVVTFKKTDPLFVFDLADPEAPSIDGELKIPGFSTYMHLMDDEHLLTIGYDADDQGDFAYFTGIQLQIIDISDRENPTLVHREIIGTRGSTSDAAANHLAFNYYGKRDMLALPMVICEGEDIFDSLMTFNGLLVYDLTAEDGFTQRGGIPSGDTETPSDSWGACSNWWTRPNSKVKRSVFMEDFVYSVSGERLRVSSASDLANPVAQLELIGP